MKTGYKRILLKLSGEALGKEGWLFDFQKIDSVASVLARVASQGIQLGVVVGGGNLWRGRQASGMSAVAADQMGMLGTLMNCLCVQDALIRQGAAAHLMSAVDIPRFAESYRAQLALQYMQEGRIVLFGGGLGNPFFTTDSAVALRACELSADAILLAKNIDGVYTDDPKRNPEAQLIRELSYEEAISRQLGVMDLSALLLCRDQQLPAIRVFALDDPENILKVLAGDPMGTLLHP
ncbi:MAG: UMP kinase [Christensenellales bacterium]